MDARGWDERYAASASLWPSEPNVWVRALTEPLPPGHALDVAAGEGRHARWLAARGWTVTAVDFSQVALARGREFAALAGVGERISWAPGDVVAAPPPGGPYDLVVIAYLQLPRAALTAALRHGAGALAPGGTLVLVGHDSTNLAEGTGGPQDPAVLYRATDVAAVLTDAGLALDLAETRRRPVPGAPRPALDAVVVAHRRT